MWKRLVLLLCVIITLSACATDTVDNNSSTSDKPLMTTMSTGDIQEHTQPTPQGIEPLQTGDYIQLPSPVYTWTDDVLAGTESVTIQWTNENTGDADTWKLSQFTSGDTTFTTNLILYLGNIAQGHNYYVANFYDVDDILLGQSQLGLLTRWEEIELGDVTLYFDEKQFEVDDHNRFSPPTYLWGTDISDYNLSGNSFNEYNRLKESLNGIVNINYALIWSDYESFQILLSYNGSYYTYANPISYNKERGDIIFLDNAQNIDREYFADIYTNPFDDDGLSLISGIQYAFYGPGDVTLCGWELGGDYFSLCGSLYDFSDGSVVNWHIDHLGAIFSIDNGRETVYYNNQLYDDSLFEKCFLNESVSLSSYMYESAGVVTEKKVYYDPLVIENKEDLCAGYNGGYTISGISAIVDYSSRTIVVRDAWGYELGFDMKELNEPLFVRKVKK